MKLKFNLIKLFLAEQLQPIPLPPPSQAKRKQKEKEETKGEGKKGQEVKERREEKPSYPEAMSCLLPLSITFPL